ncbi:peptidase U32 family protein [Niveibacterium microcysteis]|uniref:U32 family peptidase n=1 Tax=Niveibacterium microcysteis TaxID=2811415 RepID=A0ABX7M9R6_9RHOO|nr:U32 family peptidase [Niveibacterium microcysteis]QSI77404.1 U32 family peptidase [Niveibacterium microcysteis]
MSLPTHPLELLSPAKTAEIGREAILHGADAVYIGGPSFGARHNASNTVGEIAGLVAFAHRYRARIFVTLNTILHDAELEPARKLVHELYDAGVDALIVQDMGLLELDIPPIELHASTQCDIRTVEKAKFLAESGFSQIVLARELTIEQIAAVRAAVPADTVIEHFIHGALCVAFSGQCNISHAHTGRSANRGDCSQACRLPYTLQDQQGRVVAFEKHLLSMKDNNQSANLAHLIAAGVRSFKIEGRYKDASYVKNITGHYRRLLDELIEAQPELARSSSGRTELLFTPNPDKTFHRGATDYFATGRKADIGAFDTPTFVGLSLGTITRVGKDSFEIDALEPLANGDGLNYMHKREVVGLQANVVEKLGAGEEGTLWRVFPNEPVAQLPGLKPGVAVSRNRDHAWELALLKKSAERRIAVWAQCAETATGLALTLTDEDGFSATAEAAFDKQPAQNVARAESTLREHLSKFGATEFALQELTLAWSAPLFVPASVANALRRDAAERLMAARLAGWQRPLRRPEVEPPVPYPDETLSFLANVYNQAARDFYTRHGVKLIAAAYEAHEEGGEVPLMITKHCLRFSFNLCPKQAKGVQGVQGQVRAEPMTLVNGNERFTLKFDCRPCEMHVIGKAKKHILQSPPPSQVPASAKLTFYKRRADAPALS